MILIKNNQNPSIKINRNDCGQFPCDETGFNGTRPGDINQDQSVDILDLVALVTFILGDVGTTPPTTEQLCIGDIDSDGNLTILDVVQLVEFIISSTSSCPVCPDGEVRVFGLCYNIETTTYLNLNNSFILA